MASRVRDTVWSLKEIKLGTIITSLILLVGSLFFRSAPFTLGVLAGALLAFVNFLAIKKIVEKLTSETTHKKLLPGLLALFKFTLLALAVFALIYSGQVDPLGLVVGLSSVVVTLMLMAVVKRF